MSARPCTGYNQCWHQDYYFANNLLSDDVYGSRHSTNETSIVTGMANTSNGRFSDEWDKCYQELRTIHTALDAQDRMNIDETFKTRMLAELRLMRAFTYLRHGNVVRRRAVLHDQPDAPRIARRQGNARRHDQGVHPLGTCRGGRDPAEKHGYSGI